MPRKPLPPPPKKGPRKALPRRAGPRRDRLTRKRCPGGKVRITFHVLLTRQQAEALAARAIQEENSK
jgi:hypothetical protein